MCSEKKAGSEIKRQVFICGEAGCSSAGGRKLKDAFAAEFCNQMIEGIDITLTGCMGLCSEGPLVHILPEDILYCRVREENISEIVQSQFLEEKPLEKLLFVEKSSGKRIAEKTNNPFFARQKQIVLTRCGKINPDSIKEYIENSGYSALRRAILELKREDVIKEIQLAGLKGRGGGGFPTGDKWNFAANEKDLIKYVICNADEGDPGAFMDRSILEGDPHAVLEGMTIAAYAIGAEKGYFYVRAEYAAAVKKIKNALVQAEEAGFIGKNILGSKFSFYPEIRLGAGAFVCGEEMALISSIEGKRGEPRTKPPFPARKGLWGHPTVINNVETLANIPYIISEGWQKFAEIGNKNSKGTKVFALAGSINNIGLIEVPFGTSLKDIVHELGGGVPGGRRVKAVQTGGPSGGCIPAEHLDVQIDYDSLQKLGSMMGSGGMIVMDERNCMVDIARFFLEFTKEESCGKCTPCRLGTSRLLELLEKITEGKGTEQDLDKLEDLAKYVKTNSLCGLGQSAPNPILSTLKYFREEYLTHIKDKKCPAGVCRSLTSYVVDEDLCRGCSLCARKCPANAIAGKPKESYFIEQEACIRCGICQETCPFGAIYINNN